MYVCVCVWGGGAKAQHKVLLANCPNEALYGKLSEVEVFVSTLLRRKVFIDTLML